MLSGYQQRLTLGNLINNNIITTKQKGMPLRIWYTIVKQPLENKVTTEIKEFKSRNGKKFSARLQIMNGEIKFLFVYQK